MKQTKVKRTAYFITIFFVILLFSLFAFSLNENNKSTAYAVNETFTDKPVITILMH